MNEFTEYSSVVLLLASSSSLSNVAPGLSFIPENPNPDGDDGGSLLSISLSLSLSDSDSQRLSPLIR